MAKPRESAFMPTIKCSSCGRDIEISMMGEHVCTGSAAPERMAQDASPKLDAELTASSAVPTAASFFARLMGATAAAAPAPASAAKEAPAPAEKQGRTPPALDTSAANRSYVSKADLTPESYSSGSRSISPKTPNGRPGAGRGDEYFSPRIAGNSPNSRRPGGYGGFGDADAYESDYPSPNSPKKTAPSLMQRMNTIAPGPFENGRRGRNAFAPAASEDSYDDMGRSGSSASNLNSGYGSTRTPKVPRKNGYGGFGPPDRNDDFEPEPFGQGSRAGTFPRQTEVNDAPMRTPSAPGPRPDRFRRPSNDMNDRYMTSDRSRRPSRVESRPPPPRTSLVQARTGGMDGAPAVPAINLAEEFGVGNPYHSPSDSTSSSASGYSNSVQSSQASSRSSPAKSARSGRKPSDTSSFDNLMADLQQSMNENKELPRPPLQPPTKDKNMPGPMSPRFRPPPPDTRGYDPRIDPAVQTGRGRGARSPLASPLTPTSPMYDRDDPAIQGGSGPRKLSPVSAAPPSPRFPSERGYGGSQRGNMRSESLRSRSRGPREPMQRDPAPPTRDRSVSRGPRAPPQEPMQRRDRSMSREPREQTRARSLSRNRRNPGVSSRGECKSCGLAITGKSISSADGRLTGRYHKACFVCTTCQEPFSSSTFYVLDDKPYCHRHYHELNGSLCGSCGDGIEGQYLENEATQKYHVGCFRCGDCGKVLRDGYFEVNGAAYCEKDAWRRVQQPFSSNASGNGGRKGPPSGMTLGLPGGPRSGGVGLPSGNRLGPRPRMEKRMTRLGMM
ncbi:hypothetical protein GQ53DRAFT_105108 [Thozetella sp. PMI_491]|nr:hypothetical protein GQ53DRAFT_105108 [Thozetella sp. PMI_491]